SDGDAQGPQSRGARPDRGQERTGRPPVMRRAPVVAALFAVVLLTSTRAVQTARSSAGFELADVTTAAALRFAHYTGAFGRKYLPETLGSGVVILDDDGDGWQDVLLISGTSWTSCHPSPSASRMTT